MEQRQLQTVDHRTNLLRKKLLGFITSEIELGVDDAREIRQNWGESIDFLHNAPKHYLELIHDHKKSVDYRLALLIMIKSDFMSMLPDVLMMRCSVSRAGGKIATTAKKLGKRPVYILLTKIVNDLTEGKLSGVDMSLIVTEIIANYGGVFTFEDVIRAVAMGKRGDFGKVYSGKINEVMDWLKAYEGMVQDEKLKDYQEMKGEHKGAISARSFGDKSGQNALVDQWEKAMAKMDMKRHLKKKKKQETK